MARKVRRPAVLRTQFDRTFLDRTQAQYSSFVTRERDYAKSQKRMERPMPFSLDEWRQAVINELGGTTEGVCRCTYCSEVLNIKTFIPDHDIPLAKPWFGSLDIDNLVPSCRVCNGRKGAMSGSGFRSLIAWSTDLSLRLDSRDVSSVFSRLATGGGYRPMKARYEKAAQQLRGAPAATGYSQPRLGFG